MVVLTGAGVLLFAIAVAGLGLAVAGGLRLRSGVTSEIVAGGLEFTLGLLFVGATLAAFAAGLGGA